MGGRKGKMGGKRGRGREEGGRVGREWGETEMGFVFISPHP